MLSRVLHWLGLLGFAVHDSGEPRIAESERQWGQPANGFVIGVDLIDSDLSIALKNLSGHQRTLQIADWMTFYQIHIDAPLSPYGEILLKASAGKPRQNVAIPAGKFIETDLPLNRIFTLEQGKQYQVQVVCGLGVASPWVTYSG